MVVFSTDPKEGYLTQDGIRQVKSAFARRIFQQDLMHVYEQKTEYRNQLQQNAAVAMQELIRAVRAKESAPAYYSGSYHIYEL